MKQKPRLVMVTPIITTDQSLKFYNAQMVALKKGLGHYFDVTIVTRKACRGGKKGVVFAVDGIVYLDFVPIPVLHSVERAIGTYMVGLEAVLDLLNPDAVVCTEDFSFTTMRVVRFCRKRNIPSVVWQGPYYYFGLDHGFLHRIYARAIGRRVYQQATVFVGKTRKAASFLHQLGVEVDRLAVIPPCIDFELFKRNEEPRNEVARYFRKEEKTLLYVGQLLEGKKTHVLLHALAGLVHVLPGIHLLIITQGGPEKVRVKGLISRLGLGHCVTILYSVPNRLMNGFYSLAYATVSSTRNTEIFGMNILESLACGTPVVSTPHAGALEMLRGRRNGIVTDGFTDQDLALGIRTIITDSKLHEELQANARSSVRNVFSIEATSERWRELLVSLLHVADFTH